VARGGTQLPSARKVASTLFPDVDIPDNRITQSVMQWGQFIDHDFSLTPQFQFSNSFDLLSK
jgi:peroxidase